jgi:hypothetical protein
VIGFLWAVVAFLGGLGMTALGDMVSEEVRDRLDHLPHAILHLAARRLNPGQRVTVYADEWLPELTYILKGDEARPVTRLVKGTLYALGILVSTRRITSHLHREAPAPAPLPQDHHYVSAAWNRWFIANRSDDVFARSIRQSLQDGRSKGPGES